MPNQSRVQILNQKVYPKGVQIRNAVEVHMKLGISNAEAYITSEF